MAKRASLHDRGAVIQPDPRKTDDAVFGAERRRQEVQELSPRQIMPNRFQPRTQPSAEGLADLAASIRIHGVLEPIIVRPIPLTEYEGAGRRYELVAGERRWRASQLAGREAIPAIVLGDDTDDRAMLELAITENLQREDLHPLDEAMAFRRMQQALEYSYAQIGERLGKSKGYVQNRLRLLQLDADLQALVAERPDTLKHVYELAKVPDLAVRAELIDAVRDDNLSFTATKAQVAALIAPLPVAATTAATPDVPPPMPSSYSREYDCDTHHDQGHAQEPEPKSYSREYDRDTHHEKPAPPSLAAPAAPASPPPVASPETLSALRLTPQERVLLPGLTEKVGLLREHVDQLDPADWALLAPLALRLSDLLRWAGERRPPRLEDDARGDA